MKRLCKIFVFFLLLLVSSGAFAQKYYDEQWKKIEGNIGKGTFKSNLPIVLDIQNQAMKDNNVLQLIRSLKAEFSIINETEDQENNNAVSTFFAKIQTAGKQLKGKEKLLYDTLANEFFMNYYNRNSWRINGRTNLDTRDFSQIETWSSLAFKNYLLKNFAALDAQRQEMRQISLATYKDLFPEKADLVYFPTLSDWYEIQEIEFLSNSNLFTKNEITENQKKINGLYDGLIADNTGNAKLYFMHRKWAQNCSFTACKNRLEGLQNLLKSNVEGDYKVVIMQEIMQELIGSHKEKEALAVAEQAKSRYPKSLFLDNIKNTENQITNPYLQLRYEQQAQSKRPIQLVAEHKNISTFSLNIYEVKDILPFMQYLSNPYGDFVNKVPKNLVRKEDYTLPNLKDFRNHTTALEIKPLPSGIYMVEYTIPGDKVKDENQEKNFWFLVSDHKIIYQSKRDDRSDSDVLKLVSSENGKPVKTEMVFYEYAGNNNSSKTNGATGSDGTFRLPATKNEEYYRTFLIHQPATNDFQIMRSYGDNSPENNVEQKDRTMAQIFMDRAIYRPGQTVYFKVINTRIKKETESVVAGLKQKITLVDANDEDISSQTFTTNEFGSYHGSFILPKGKLNGTFYLRTDGDQEAEKDFRVEEYKRPKFEVTFEPVKEEYQYGQTIMLKGKAMMFSGVPLSNTTVQYEIKKRDIRWRYFPWYDNGNNNENSVLGEAKTNEKGEFTIRVDLKKDEKREGVQIDNYEINASVTDINGETQSAETQLKVASVSHYIKAGEINNVFAGENVTTKVETKNYNDQELKKAYKVNLSRLQSADRIFRNNFQAAVQDLHKLSKPEFISKFPHDFYDKNDEPKERKVSAVVLNSAEKNQQTLDLGPLQAGDYKLELYNIEGKDTIKTEQYFSVWDKKALHPDQKPFLSVVAPKGEFTRGGSAVIYAYSAVPDAQVNVFVQDGSGKTLSETRQMKNGVLEYRADIPKDKAVNELNIQFQVVAFNDIQTESVTLKIKDSEAPLKIETVTFRDKIEPGSKEKWSVKVTGNQKEKINAEVLANMYDMSLDQFASNSFDWQKMNVPYSVITSYTMNPNLLSEYYQKRLPYFNNRDVMVPDFSWFDGNLTSRYNLNMLQGRVRGVAISEVAAPSVQKESSVEEVVVRGYKSKVAMASADKAASADSLVEGKDLDKVAVRQNLNETAFFYPDLKTDSEGNVSFEFTSPEALTKWKLMFLAHTKDARAATLEKEVVTQKEFSVTPNYPRFLREGDELNLQSRLSNLTDKKLNGSASLQILDAFTNEDISSKFGLNAGVQNFELAENGNAALTWKLKAPENLSSIIIKVVAKAGQYSDGEQQAVAVLPNRMLVTDAVPVFVKQGETKTFVLDQLKNANSKTISNVSNTLELTTNPVWEIMFALPSMKNDLNNSADVIFNKWFADVLASEIFKANPKMKTVFEEYQNKGLLQSNLEKNQELKQLLLEETPWVLGSSNEQEQMQKLALLFDANTMKNSTSQDWEELKNLQNPDGGFSWYPGYPSSYGVSLYILRNLGKINQWLKGNMKDYQDSEQNAMVAKLVEYTDTEISKYTNGVSSKDKVWNNMILDYLNTRHYWEQQYPLKGKGAQLKTLVQQQAKTVKMTDLTFFGLHRIALLMNSYGHKDVSDKLMNYLKETSTETKTQGTYWKQNLDDWGWFSSKVVNHAGAIEAFSLLRPQDQQFIEDLKIWLVTQKEVNSWGSSRATAEVIFTILNSGQSWTGTESNQATIVWGGKQIQPQTQATGYVKSTVKSDALDKNLATVTVTKPGPGIVQGGLFWQYYEDLDKIKSSETYLSVSKELYRKIKTVNGEELQPISAQTPLKTGDRVTVRMILNTDRPMEFIHIKDMRAAGFEPADVLSGYQWKNGLSYYQSAKDASTNFYIQAMPKGNYVFEYDVVANASGKFSNGITTIQNYYAPQMNAHTQGTQVTISE